MASTLALKSKRKSVEEPVEKQETWAFTDMECRVDKKIAFKWNTLFQECQTKEFQVLLQDDPSTELNKVIYKNISKSGLHQAAAKTPFLPCLNVIEWMTRRIDHESRIILNFEDKHVANYQAPVLN
jgi:Txe/YoeB family toxin of Txe-Axe toxin-antitoxin module